MVFPQPHKFRKRPTQIVAEELPERQPQTPRSHPLNDRRLRPPVGNIKAGSKSHHCPIKKDGDHIHTQRCIDSLHSGYCPIHHELVSYNHGCHRLDDDRQQCGIKGAALRMELRNPRSPPKTDENEENELGMAATTTPVNGDNGFEKKLRNVANPGKDLLKQGAAARDANDQKTYTHGNVHRNDKGLKAMTARDDVNWLKKKQKELYKRSTLFNVC